MVLLFPQGKIELANYPIGCTQNIMNARESSFKSSKNQFRVLVDQRVSAARIVKEKRVLSPEKLAEKAAGFAAWQAKKAQRKRLRSKHHLAE